MASRNCHKCRTDWDAGGKRQPGFKETCVKCGAWLHCCRNCRHHRPSLHNQCYIPNTEWVGDRLAANFCEEFEFAATDPASEAPGTDREAQKSSFDALFGGDTQPDDGESPTRFDDLFRR